MSRKCTSELRVRLTDAEYVQIQNNAANCGLTISDYVRKLIREEPLIQKPKKAAATQADKENAILAEIRQVNDAIDNE